MIVLFGQWDSFYSFSNENVVFYNLCWYKLVQMNDTIKIDLNRIAFDVPNRN